MLWGCANAQKEDRTINHSFVETVDAKLSSGGGLSQAEFNEIKGMYDGLGNLEKYSLSSRMAARGGDHGLLDQCLRHGGYTLYTALGGSTE